MNFGEFLEALRETNSPNLVWQSCPDGSGIRAVSLRKGSTGVRYSPITAVCMALNHGYYGMHQWREAAQAIGLPSVEAELIEWASDVRSAEEKYQAIRNEICEVLQVQDIPVSKAWITPSSSLCTSFDWRDAAHRGILR